MQLRPVRAVRLIIAGVLTGASAGGLMGFFAVFYASFVLCPPTICSEWDAILGCGVGLLVGGVVGGLASARFAPRP